ncbi:HAD-IA family hydrolase [Motilibacter aurantiacus]|uniref:HAD-IA family hydrolase n=1 Tax=Motilibacter aurantiacus TaxID=2714955 RepID=UPI001408AF7B|nr:HAD-IA family hydrolase [Motilibacter aurantiacus]
MATTLLLDYGAVISFVQTEEDLRGLEAVVPQVPPAALWEAYWAHRLDYDLGLDDAAYWAAVLGRPATGDELAELVRRDVDSWLHVNQAVAGALPGLRARGVRLGLLSNAPAAIARRLEEQPWTQALHAMTFSCDIPAAKPDPAAYTAALDALGAAAEDVVFVDDRAENVEGARALGITAVHFVEPDVALAEALRHLGIG